MKFSKILCALGATAVLSAPVTALAGAVYLNEGFDGPGLPSGWLLSPAVSPTTPINWAKPVDVNGPSGEFPAQAGAIDSYFFNSFNSTPTGVNMISDYLITPLLTISNGTIISFYVKADPTAEASFPDRLRVLMSNGGTAVSSFTSLLFDINPTYSPTGFPTDWTMYSSTITGLNGPTAVRFAFNYLISDTLTQGDFIGLDTVSVTIPEPGTMALLALGVLGLGLRSRRARG